MDNSYLNMAEAFIKMSESLVRMVKAIKRAQASFEDVLRLQYRAAGRPFGDSEEGMRMWRTRMSENTTSGNRTTSRKKMPQQPCGLALGDSHYFSGRFIFLSEEVSKRIN